MIDAHEKYLHHCAICHDQCQFSVAELFATGRMTYATSRKAMLIQAVRRGDLDWTPDVVEVIYAGLNSGIQHEVCVNYGDPEGWSDETIYLRAARANIAEAGKAPEWAKSFRRNFQNSGNPYGLVDDIPANSGDLLLFFDAATRLYDPEGISAWQQIIRNVGNGPGWLASGSSGFELYDLGFVAEAQQAARVLYEVFISNQPSLIISDSPEAVYMLTRIWPSWGLQLPMLILHTSEWLAEKLVDLGIEAATSGNALTFLDPSCLGRYLDQTEPPRQALTRLGVPLVEMVRNRRQALPSGSYYGEMVGEWTRRIAVDCRDWGEAVGALGIITASPFDQRNLRSVSDDRFEVIPFWQAVLEGLTRAGR